MSELLAEKIKKSAFVRCINCSRYIETDLKGKTLYCCNQCAEKFRQCEICGQFYSTEKMHYDSLKCMIKFDVNKKKHPFIRQTMLKLFITGTPLLNTGLLAERLSLVLKLPVFMSEQFRIADSMTLTDIKNRIEHRIRAENISNHYIYLGNSYNADFLQDFLKDFIFDKFIFLNKRNSDSLNTGHDDIYKNTICTKCGSINCFSQADFEGRTECLICGNDVLRTTEDEVSIQQKVKKYRDCEEYISSSFPDKCFTIDYTSVLETVNEIVKYLIYS